MPRPLACPQGHQWDADALAGAGPGCPICGGAGVLVDASTLGSVPSFVAGVTPARVGDAALQESTTIAPAAIEAAVLRPALTEEVPLLLRKRLLFLALLMTGALVVNLLQIAGTDLPEPAWVYFGTVLLGLGPVAGVVLWVRRSLSLRQLRAVELVLFGVPYVQWASGHAFLWPNMVVLPQPPLWYGSILASAVSTPWIVLIILYGVLIPNTWRRCAAVVGVLAVTPLVISVANGLAARVTEGHSPANYLFPLGFWLAVAVAIAVYGSHRIEVLRRQAAAARKLGPYQLGRRLGAGGMGEVYLAEHRLLKRPCAVKLIRPDQAGDPSVLRRFEREVQATAALTHPNTVQVYDYGHADDGTFYYAMEYVAGLNLDELVRRSGPLPPARAVHVLRQLCGALAEAHAAGLIHRDVKPGNVILGQRGGRADVAKLLDFGLVRDVDPRAAGLTLDGTIAGTPAYLSPEQAAGGAGVDARSDVYAVGALAYFLLTGRPPFVGPSAVAVIAAHLYEAAEPPSRHRPEVPADLEAVVLRCLAKRPTERFADVASLDAALAGCASAGGWSTDEAAAWWRAQTGAGESPR